MRSIGITKSGPSRADPWVWACVLGTGLALTACGGGPPRGVVPPENAPHALVVGAAQSPILDELGKSVRFVPHNGTQKVSDYDLLILDGDAHTPEALRGNELVGEALRLRKRILFVDLSERHKKEGLGSLLGFSTKGPSGGYMVEPREGRGGRTLYRIIGNTPLESFPTRGTSGSPANVTGYAKAISQELKLSRQLKPQDSSASEPDTPIPADLINYQWLYTWVGDNYIAYAGKVSGRQPQHFNFQINYTINLFLNNKNSAQGDYQYVVIHVDGTENPTYGTGYFYNMAKDEKAWFAGRVHLTLEPEDDSVFTWVSNDPQTPNAVTTYTANSSFNVGFAGATGVASYTWGTSQSYSLSDWKVSSNSAGNDMSWDFRSGNPDADQDYGSCEWRDCGTWGTDYPKDPNDLSKGQLTFHASAAYRTSGVVTGWHAFDSGGYLQLVDTYCAKDAWLTCFQFGAYNTFPAYIQAYGLEINMGAVVPIPIQNISFSQDVVPAGKPATGTLTLSSPAVVDTVIPIQSNSPNATVLPTVTVPAGETSGTFQILTNANGIPTGGVSTATISAFYAQNFQTQLAVKNYAPTDLQPPTSSPGTDSQHWAQNVPFGRWVSGYQVRYAVSFVGPNGETERGPWTPWFSGEPYALPLLVNISTDPTGRATGRKVYRQFYSDYSSSDPSAGVTLIGTLNDNTSTTLQDNSF